MYHKKSESNIKDNKNACNNVKTAIEENYIDDNKNIKVEKESSLIYKNNGHIKQDDFDKNFVMAYIGTGNYKMYESVKKFGINIWSFIYGIGYYAYRKMYLISILILIIAGIICSLFPACTIIISIFIGLMFYPIYRFDMTRKLKKIKKNNSTADEKQLLEIAKNKGGTSIIGAIIFLAIYIVIIIFI